VFIKTNSCNFIRVTLKKLILLYILINFKEKYINIKFKSFYIIIILYYIIKGSLITLIKGYYKLLLIL
jgi:hypothetical protein